MNSRGFGFSFGNNNDDNDDDDNKNNEDNMSFGAFSFGFPGGAISGGNLGDILNQFGRMLTGMATPENSEQEPVNYQLAERIARQELGRVSPVTSGEKNAVAEAVRLVELWLEDATTLPASNGTVEAWSTEDYLAQTMPAWKRLVNPVAENMKQAQIDALPEEAQQMMAPMLSAFGQMATMNFGMQFGNALGDLAKQALTGCDFGLPVAPAHTIALLPHNVTSIAQELDVESRDVLIYLAAREAAHQRLFAHVPWLVERLVSSVEEYAAGLVIDNSNIEEATRELHLDSVDPAHIQEIMARLQGADLSPRITSRNAGAVSRLETLLALVEGWTEFVVEQALGERIPATAALTEAWRRRRATGASAEQAFASVVGIEFAAPKVSDAITLWQRVDNAVGQERRDAVWNHPDFLPTAEDLDSPAEFIDGLLDTSDMNDFDPIAEIQKLEAEGKIGATEDKENRATDHKEDGATGTQDDTAAKEDGADGTENDEGGVA